MKLVIQRVRRAAVSVDEKIVGQIDKGLLLLLGVGADDTKENADWLVNKLSVLRIFEDENGKTNLSTLDVGGSLLVVSQFTLYADCRKGSRPSFTEAAPPALANTLYMYFTEKCREVFPIVETGVFGAHMDIDLLCDGPFTVTLEH
ncbi:MAG: D-tyrosyl-tRNA(Tyr) deacylase [Clostridia bacterium]|nr:D-tyrosyl-tRNA(Tyr) deacylase [Oscillospiraceae bacterium]MBQ7033483.1 D-tyrosyl-tRNA(Tyr) deacylase [Clostridia bacterium]